MKCYNVTEDNITYSIKECANGTKYWYLNNQRHRINGPAVECADGYRAWYLNNQRHREHGPAIEYANGNKQWYFHDTRICCHNLKNFTRQIKLLSIS